MALSNDYTGVVEKLPHVFRIEPSSACNLKCIHCPTGVLESNDRQVMSWEIFELIIRDIKTIKPTVAVLYHGGEPFINKKFFKMIEELKSNGVSFIKTVTNGMLLNEEMLRKIIRSGLDSIEFSLDGHSAEENDEIRRGASYKKVSGLIRRLIILKHNLHSITPEIYISSCQIASGLETDIKKPEIAHYITEDFARYHDEVKFKVCYALRWPGLPIDTSKYTLSEPVDTGQTGDYCENPIELITIRANGDVVACCYDITSCYVLGNIKETPLEKIWNNERYRTLRRSIKDKKYLPLCQNCEVVRPQQLLIRNISSTSTKISHRR
jgi:radical SAM protein with 4Fe4S-binding SPASM domain